MTVILSYRIISNLLYTVGCAVKFILGLKFDCNESIEFKDQTVYYYACAIQTKAWEYSMMRFADLY